MNEEDILKLELAGFTYKDGVILDKEGNFIENVELSGNSYSSGISKEDYESLEEAEKIYKQNSLLEEQAKNQQRQDLLDYSENPLLFNTPEISDEIYEEYKNKNIENNIPVYEDKQDFIKETEQEAIDKELEKLGTGENIETKAVLTKIAEDPLYKDVGLNMEIFDELAPTEKRIKEIEGIDEDMDTRVDRYDKESEERLDNMAWYNPERITVWIDRGVGQIFKALSPDGFNMKDEKLQEEYKELNQRREEILKPEVEKITAALTKEYEELTKLSEDHNLITDTFGRSDEAINNYVAKQLKSKIDYLTAYSEDSNLYNLLSEEFLSDAATFGLKEGHDALKYQHYLYSKLNRISENPDGEEQLTPTEQRALENLARVQLLDGLNLEQNPLYNLTYGAGHSVTYLGGGVFGRMVGKGVGKAVSKSVVKGLEKGLAGKLTSKLSVDGANLATRQSIGKATGLLADVGVQATLHTSNLFNTIDNYHGGLHMTIDENGKIGVSTDRAEYQALKNEIERYEEGLAKGLGDEQQRKDAQQYIKELKEILKNTKEPQTWAGAAAKSWTGNFTESASEVATLGVLKGIPNNLVTRKLMSTRTGRKLNAGIRRSKTWKAITDKNSFINKSKDLIEKINKPFPKTIEALNNFSGKRLGNVTIGSNLEEALEEVVVQLTPVWGETDAEAAARKDELLKGSFYFNVMAQSPIQKLIMSPVGNTIRATNYIGKQFDKDYKTTKKNFKSLMKDLEKEGITKEEIDGIMMAAGSGNFSQTEYKNKIKEYEDQGKFEEARKIRENRVFNAAFQAVKHGKGKQFISALENSLAKQDAPTTIPSESEARTRAATVQAINEIKIMMQETKKVEGMPNQEYVLNLNYNKRNLQKNKEQLEKDISELSAQEETEARNNDMAFLNEALADTDAALKTLEGKIQEEYSPKKLKQYRDEAEMAKFAKEHYAKEKAKKDSIKEGETLTEEQKPVALETALREAYGKTVSKKSYDKILDYFSAVEIMNTYQEELAEAAKTEVVGKDTGGDTGEVVGGENNPSTIPNPFGEGNISSDNTQEIDTPAQEFKNDTQEVFQTIEDTVDSTQLEGGMDALLEMEVDEMIQVLDNSDSPENPLKSIANSMKAFVENTEKRTGKKPSFRDFLLAISEDSNIENYQSYLTLLGNAWAVAGLGKADVKEIYQEALNISKNIAEKIALANIETTEETEESKEKTKQENIKSGIEASPVHEVKRDSNGIPIVEEKKEDIYDQTFGVNTSAIEFEEVEVEDEKTGEIYIKRVVSPIPKLNEEAREQTKNLKNPNKNNKGDILNIELPKDNDNLGDTFVSVRDEKGKTLRRITFSQWVEENRGEMSVEEFSKTDQYISKVPIHYKDKEGNIVGFVAESEWHNALSEGEKEGNRTKVSNLSDIEKKEIEKKRLEALNLRKEILEGNVKEFEIISDGTSFVHFYFDKDENGEIIPPKKLSEVAGDSIIAVMGTSKLHFVVDGQNVPTEDIINWGDAESGYSKKIMKEDSYGNISPQLENIGKTVYLQHVSTVNGVKKYEIVNVLRRNEKNENRARQDAIDTVRLLAIANTVLQFKKPTWGTAKYKMTVEQAQQIHDEVKEKTGLSLSTSLSELVESLVKTNIKYPNNHKDVNKRGKTITSGLDIASLANKIYTDREPAIKDENFVQNTVYGRDSYSGPIITIKQEGDSYVVDNFRNSKGEPTQSYEEYLKETLSTNLMGWNIGTEENPIFTPAVQQKVIVKPIRKADTRTVEQKIEEEKSKPEVQEKIEEVKEEVKESKETSEILNEREIQETLEQAERKNKAIETATALINRLGGTIESVEDSDELIVSEMSTTENVENSIMITEGLTVEQEEDIIGSLGSELANKEAEYETILNNLSKNLKEEKEQIERTLKELEEFKDNIAIQNLIKALNRLNYQLDQVENNKEKLLSEASKRGKRDNFVVDEYEETEGENVKDYSKKSNESKPIDKIGTALKRIFAQIDTGETGFLGRKKIAPFKSMYDTVLLTLSGSIGANTNFKDMMNILSDYQESNPWVKQLIEKLESSDENIQNAFVYNMHAQKVMAYFSGFNQTPNELETTFYESNSNSAIRVIKENWKENFKRSEINNKGDFNKEKLKELYEQFISWGVSPEKQSPEVLTEWLNSFGIRLSEKTMEEIFKGNLKMVKDGVTVSKSLKELFEENNSIFKTLFNFTKQYKDYKGGVDFYSNTNLHPFNDMHSILTQLAYLEAKNNSKYASTTRYIAGKSVTEVENMTYFYQQIRKLKNSAMAGTDYIKKLRQTSFAKDSYMLKMLVEDSEFLESFDHGFMDLMSLKEMYKDNPMFAGIDELSEEDYRLALRIAYQAKGRKSRLDKNTGFKIRLTHMNTLTNSDKGRMMMLKTFVYDFYNSDQAFIKNEDGEFEFTDELNELMYDNYVMPELRRMFNFIKNGKNTNIKGYDKGAVRFNVFPVLNTIKNSEGKTIQESIVSKLNNKENKKDEEELLSEIKKEFLKLAAKEIEKNTLNEAKKIVDKSFERTETGIKKKTGEINDTAYLNQREGDTYDKNLLAEVDYILNSKLTSMNYMQMVAGDPALYYKSSADVNSKNLKEITKASIDSAINIGKRMAAMIAPGKNLADSKGNQYIQLFLEDVEGAAENLEDIIGWHYSKDEIDSVNQQTGRTYRELIKEVVKGNRDFENILKAKFSNIADFIGIESTDAQEYTTVQEHLYIMEKQGRVPQDIINSIREKIRLQREYEAKNPGKEIPKELSLSSVIESENKSVNGLTQLQILLQPIKPVYTGSILENDVNRMVYIKSSSFPLIPELTKGRKLDDLRLKMEKIELEEKKTVRASYQTANKVGALKNPFVLGSETELVKDSNYLVLDREHFKIQQDVPSYANKVHEDKVSMGTQIFKLLMGDGIDKMKGFKYKGETIDGEDLKQKFFEVFSQMIDNNKLSLLDSLGLDENMNPIDEKESQKLLSKLLIEEAKSRGFSKQDLKALELVGKRGNFRMPLWATGNSNKFEAMLNALINNKIFKQKIPGNKFVTGSEAGFEVKESTEGIKGQNKIVYIGDYKGGTLKSTKNAKGEIIKAEVLLPSKFKIGGRLIDIFADFDEETGQGKYIEVIEGTYQLKENMFDKELLEQFVFRIPTSSHGLGSAVKVVGFLPPESGDLIITPKSFVAQMGQDFDIDSLTAYQYNHTINEETGRIEKLTDEHLEPSIKALQDKILGFEERINKLYKGDLKAQRELQLEISELINNINPETGVELQEKEVLLDELFNKLDDKYTLKIEKLKEYIEKLKAKHKRKMLENDFIEMHISVFSNPKAQPKIQKALSMKYAEDQADDIQTLIEKSLNEDEQSYDMLSPEYQRIKMNNGSTGQVAIGIYAKAVTLHSNFQQALSKGGVRLMKFVYNEDGGKDKVNTSITIGNLTSNGEFGNSNTLVSKEKGDKKEEEIQKTLLGKLRRAITTVLDERTNTGTDNEKAQILGKTGLNHKSAIAVDSMLSLLGFDSEHEILGTTLEEAQKAGYIEGEPFNRKKEIDGKTVYYKEYAIPYLLHSQPIIKEFFSLLNTKESISNTSFSARPKEDALKELIRKYAPEGTIIKDGQIGRIYEGKFVSTQNNATFTGARLANNIVLDKKASTTQQLEILAFYSDLINKAEEVKKAGQLIDMNNLGKSMWESTEKENEFREYFTTFDKNSSLEGIENLVGEVVYGEDVESTEGFIPLGRDAYLKPTTNQGVMVGTALSLSNGLFNGLFPSKSVFLNKVITSVLDNSKVNTNNTTAKIRAKEFIFQEIKKYITTYQGLGIFNTNAKTVRESLFKDTDDNLSLSTYTDHIMSQRPGKTKKGKEFGEYTKGIKAVQNNLFLNMLNFTYGEKGKPSLITLNNQETFEANQEAIYTSLKQLIVEDLSLPRKNGEYYSTRLLAQELIAYSYASGGIVQGALEFHKFLPMEYLDDIGRLNSKGQKVSSSQVFRNFNTIFNSQSEDNTLLDSFERQFFQNNPNQAQQKALKKNKMEDGQFYYTLKEEAEFKPQYIASRKSTKSKLKQHKWSLYELTDSGVYLEIPVLGETGMAEYEVGNNNLTSINENKPTQPIQSGPSKLQVKVNNKPQLKDLPPAGTKLVDIFKGISNGEFGDFKNMKEIVDFLTPLLNKDESFVYGDKTFIPAGSTKAKTGKITLNTNFASKKDFASTLIHEAIHNITVRYLDNYVDRVTGEVKEGSPAEVYTLMNVYNQYKNQLRNLDPAKYDNFIKEYKEYKKKRTNNEKIIPDEMFTLKGDEFEMYYSSINPREFLAVTLANQNPLLLKTMNSMDYLAVEKGLKQKFVDLILRIVDKIAKKENLRDNSLALQALKATLLVSQKGGEYNAKQYEKTNLSPDMMAAMNLSEQQPIPDSIILEGESAGATFLSITGINNKCK